MEHENLATTHLDADWSARAPLDRRVVILGFRRWRGPARSAFPTTYWPHVDDGMIRHELRHFLQSVRLWKKPCNTIDDAAHVMRWASRVAAELRIRTSSGSQERAANPFDRAELA